MKAMVAACRADSYDEAKTRRVCDQYLQMKFKSTRLQYEPKSLASICMTSLRLWSAV
jgi:hypothetical protein